MQTAGRGCEPLPDPPHDPDLWDIYIASPTYTGYNETMKRLPLYFLSVFLILVLASCMTAPSDKDRGSLSDAMDKARDDYPEEREVPDEDKEFPPEEEERQQPEEDDTGIAEQPASFDGPVYFGGRGGNAVYSYPYFEPYYDAELLLGYGVKHTEVLLYGGYKAVTPKDDSEIKESIEEGVLILRGGVEGRYYPFPELQVFSPYALAQFGGLYMYWSFRNPLTAGADTIAADSVFGFMLGAGAGVNLINTDSFRLGGAFIPELFLFYSETQEGFENDVFDFYSTVRWAIEVGFMTD
jgi:hypothetical protein